MKNEIEKKSTDIIQPVDKKTLVDWLASQGLDKRLTFQERTIFLQIATLYGLNPFKREIYCVVYGEGKYRTCSIITGYEVYLKRAERLGTLNGWHCEYEGTVKDGTFAVTVVINRKDWQYPFKHTAFYNEVKQDNRVWIKMPMFMTKKVAVCQAFRMCFPDEFGGMPYTNDELGLQIIPDNSPPGKEIQAEVVDTNKVSAELQELMTLTAKYEKELSSSTLNPTPFVQCENAITSGEDAKIKNTLARVKKYLSQKGVVIE